MCLGLPMRVVERLGPRRAMACDAHGRSVELDTSLVGPVEAGDWVLAFLGSARERIEPARAAEVQQLLDWLAAPALADSEGGALAFELPSAMNGHDLAALTNAGAPTPATAPPAP